jgi:hypothetical protein
MKEKWFRMRQVVRHLKNPGGCSAGQKRELEAPGIEPGTTLSQGKTLQSLTAIPLIPLAQTLARETQIDPDLARVIAAWTTLPEHLKAAILALIQTAK